MNPPSDEDKTKQHVVTGGADEEKGKQHLSSELDQNPTKEGSRKRPHTDIDEDKDANDDDDSSEDEWTLKESCLEESAKEPIPVAILTRKTASEEHRELSQKFHNLVEFITGLSWWNRQTAGQSINRLQDRLEADLSSSPILSRVVTEDSRSLLEILYIDFMAEGGGKRYIHSLLGCIQLLLHANPNALLWKIADSRWIYEDYDDWTKPTFMIESFACDSTLPGPVLVWIAKRSPHILDLWHSMSGNTVFDYWLGLLPPVITPAFVSDVREFFEAYPAGLAQRNRPLSYLPIHILADSDQTPNLELVKLIAGMGADTLLEKESRGRTPFFIACEMYHMDADCPIRREMAAMTGTGTDIVRLRMDIVRTLFNAAEDPCAVAAMTNHRGEEPLHFLSKHLPRPEVFEFMLLHERHLFLKRFKREDSNYSQDLARHALESPIPHRRYHTKMNWFVKREILIADERARLKEACMILQKYAQQLPADDINSSRASECAIFNAWVKERLDKPFKADPRVRKIREVDLPAARTELTRSLQQNRG